VATIHVTPPHHHLGAGVGTVRGELVKAHLPTDRVTPAALLALLLDRFGVRPRRADRQVALDQAQQALEPA
jgi:hypothetical protein